MKRLLLIPIFAAALAAQEPAGPKEAEHKAGEPAEESNEIWKWANFGILAAGLGYLMAKNLPPVFKSRSKEIQSGISEAQQMKLDAERRSAEMDARLASLGADIEKFRAESQAEMQQEGERIGRETAAELKKIEERAAVEIESAGKAARRQLKDYAAELALGMAEERLRARMDSAAESALVDNFARDLEQQKTLGTGSKN
jgi:F-type H+-transporting ATPase subunit b